MDQNGQAAKKKILIVEDDFYIRDLYSIQAKLMNYEVITAADGEEAIANIRSHQPDLVLLDLMLPKVDGMTVLKTIKADPACANVKFIITTNLEDASTEQAAKKLGALEFILKLNNPPLTVLEIAKKHLD